MILPSPRRTIIPDQISLVLSPLNVRELFPFDVDDLLYSKLEELCMLIRHCDVVQEA